MIIQVTCEKLSHVHLCELDSGQQPTQQLTSIAMSFACHNVIAVIRQHLFDNTDCMHEHLHAADAIWGRRVASWSTDPRSNRTRDTSAQSVDAEFIAVDLEFAPCAALAKLIRQC